ncbi:DnaB-like helicase C-terminal domain-containing protein [Planktomarina sp.]|uniref:DnaB-like helicase C-terminal domain-containing protein n=1 Tax=Planktomarina sp. TaxID=2024851 RepID=UPI003261B932
MNLASVLFKTIIAQSDIETWSNCQKHYFPAEFASIWSYINKYVETHSIIPTFDDLRLSVRDATLRDRFFALEKVDEVDIDGATLLEYLKNEYTQIEIMNQLETYLADSIAMESAQENIESLQNIVLSVEEKVDLKDTSTNMRKMELFDPIEELEKNVPLGLNHDFDRIQTFGPSDLVLIGGKRGAGKSIACANIASSTYEAGHSVMYFTIEMSSRATMQRICSISTGVPAAAIRNRNLSIGEWEQVARWWSQRFEDGERALSRYLSHRDFDVYHNELTAKPLREKQIDVVYSPSLTLANIRTELDKKIARLQPRVVIVDYINQVKRSMVSNGRMGQYDWTEQIEVSKALKTYAQDYGFIMVSPYQIDASGEARFAKGILDAADAAFTLDAHAKEDNIISFNCAKMRNSDEVSFTSTMDWASLAIGPETGYIKDKDGPDEEVYEL